MKYFFVLLAFAAIIAVSFGAESGCEFRGKILKLGETYTPIGECSIYECVENGGITGKTCPAFATKESCKKEQDLTKPFPECCPKMTDCE